TGGHTDVCHSGTVAEPDLDAAVERAIAGLADLADVPVAEHVARFDAVHQALAEALSAIDGA
ncbi:MAG TPA: hypothetical protein VGJ95_01105, partial [Pseudonocardiaceae bacterium]